MPCGTESATLVCEGGVVEPAERFLAHLTAIERSPNTVRAYAHDLRDFLAYLRLRDIEWSGVVLEDVGRVVAWLRLPDKARGSDRVSSLPWVEGTVSAATVNRKLSAFASFYEFHHRHGVDVGELLTRWRLGRRGGSWQPFLAHLGNRPERQRTIGLRAEQRAPRSLSPSHGKILTDACDRLRDRFLLTLLAGTGLRIGEALGLRHEDIDARRQMVVVQLRANANHARAKTRFREVPVTAGLIRCYSDYLHEEHRALDSDYVFVNLWGDPRGEPMSYAGASAGAALAGANRDRVCAAPLPARLRHRSAAVRCCPGDRAEATGPCVDLHHARHLLPRRRRR